MVLLKNNIKVLGIHLVMMLFSLLEVGLFVIASPFYPSKFVALLVGVIGYVGYLYLYIIWTSRLELPSEKWQDYLGGILTCIVGCVVWLGTLGATGDSLWEVAMGNQGYWSGYNLFIFASWGVLYGQQVPIYLLVGSIVPNVLCTIGIKRRRKLVAKKG